MSVPVLRKVKVVQTQFLVVLFLMVANCVFTKMMQLQGSVRAKIPIQPVTKIIIAILEAVLLMARARPAHSLPDIATSMAVLVPAKIRANVVAVFADRTVIVVL